MRNKRIFDATLTVTLLGTGCVWCDALRWFSADEHRYCGRTGEVLEHYKTERGKDCVLENITERQAFKEEE